MLNFVGIGAQKAGTTWIAENLAKHPDLAFPAGKEVHFWDNPKKYAKGVSWYAGLFANDAVQNGEITPAYAILDVDKIRELYSLNSQIKLIYCVRNPIDRAWSAARMRLGRSKMTMEEATDAWFMDVFLATSSLMRGDYIRAVDNWLSIFPRKQLLLLDFEEISRRPHELLQEICRHIGVDGDFFLKEKGNVTIEKVYRSPGTTEIRPSLLPELHRLFDDSIAAMKEHPVLGAIYGND